MKECVCTSSQVSRYQKKVSDPLLDRIDIHLDVPAVKVEKLVEQKDSNAEDSAIIRNRVQKARDLQTQRFSHTKIISNADLTNKSLKEFCSLSDDCVALLQTAVTKLNLSGRGYNRTLKVARTIADLGESESILPEHIAEALQYRSKVGLP